MWQFDLKEKPGHVANHPHHMSGQLNLPRNLKILMNNLVELGRERIDKICFWISFFLFLIFNIVYWYIYLYS